MDDDEQLWEEDDIDKVGAHGPEAVDGRDGESHDGGHAAHHKDGDPHHPHNLRLASL